MGSVLFKDSKLDGILKKFGEISKDNCISVSFMGSVLFKDSKL